VQEMNGLPAATDEEAMEDLLRRHNNSSSCVDCGEPLGGVYYGAGDGRGQRFRCEACNQRTEAFRWLIDDEQLHYQLLEKVSRTATDDGVPYWTRAAYQYGIEALWTIASLRSLLLRLHDSADNMNMELCVQGRYCWLCRAGEIDSVEGVVHSSTCPLKMARLVLKGLPHG